ncbi:response regulator [Vallitaleaceae bacterium 9-2]
MYKLLIIDDEPEIRKGIKNVIQWEANNITVCAEASNGIEALSLIDEIRPDIILVDIRMPKMDGLELLKVLKEQNTPFHAIVLSSYDEFSYAQQAMALGVQSYLLKPSRPAQILDAVLKIIASIESASAKEQKIAELYNQVKHKNSLLKDRYLIQCIEGNPPVHIPSINLSIHPENILVFILGLDTKENVIGQDMSLINFCIINIAEEIFLHAYPCEIITYNQQVILLCNDKINKLQCEIIPQFRHLQLYLKKQFDISVSIGISRDKATLSNMAPSYRQASMALDQCYFMGKQSIVQYQLDFSDHLKKLDYPITIQSELINALFNGTPEDVSYHFKRFIASLKETALHNGMFNQHCYTLILSIFQVCSERSLVLSDDIHNFALNFLSDTGASQKYEVVEKTSSLIQMTHEEIHKRQHTNNTINICVKYIKENYDSNISLEKVASIAHISPGYLSQLFKQVMEVNYVDYLNIIRIENACTLLKDTTLKTYDIATMVGYKSEKYFSKKFKQYMHMTPSEYKKGLLH